MGKLTSFGWKYVLLVFIKKVIKLTNHLLLQWHTKFNRLYENVKIVDLIVYWSNYLLICYYVILDFYINIIIDFDCLILIVINIRSYKTITNTK